MDSHKPEQELELLLEPEPLLGCPSGPPYRRVRRLLQHVELDKITLPSFSIMVLLCIIHFIIATIDYKNLTIILNFNESSTIFEVPLTIIDDDVLENDEEFTVLLELMDAKYGRVMLEPNVSVITIMDNDS